MNNKIRSGLVSGSVGSGVECLLAGDRSYGATCGCDTELESEDLLAVDSINRGSDEVIEDDVPILMQSMILKAVMQVTN